MLKGKFHKKRLPNLKYDNNKIKYYETLKYLGIVIDKNLNFIKHAKHIKDKTKKCAQN